MRLFPPYFSFLSPHTSGYEAQKTLHLKKKYPIQNLKQLNETASKYFKKVQKKSEDIFDAFALFSLGTTTL